MRAAIVFADGWDYTEFSQIGPPSGPFQREGEPATWISQPRAET